MGIGWIFAFIALVAIVGLGMIGAHTLGFEEGFKACVSYEVIFNNATVIP